MSYLQAKMSFLCALKSARWVRRWDGEVKYGLRLGNRGRNGCIVPLLTHTELFLIRDFFLEFGVEKDATELWWTEKKFAYETDIDGTADRFYHSGIEFTISKKAFEKMFH